MVVVVVVAVSFSDTSFFLSQAKMNNTHVRGGFRVQFGRRPGNTRFWTGNKKVTRRGRNRRTEEQKKQQDFETKE